MAEGRANLLTAACDNLGVAVQHLVRAVPLSPLTFGAPPHPPHQFSMAGGLLHQLPMASGPLHQLPMAGPLPHVRPPPALPLQHHHQDHEMAIRVEDEGDDEDEHEDEDEDEDDEHEDEHEHEHEDEDDFAFALQNLYHCTWPLLAAAPPYPLYRGLSDTDLQAPAWVWYLFCNALVFTAAATFLSVVVFRSAPAWVWCLFCNALVFTAAITFLSVIVFRSSRRFVPTFLRALLLAVTIGAEAATAFHLPPSSRLATILSYISITLHVSIYLFTWAVYRYWSRRRLHPLP